MAISSTPSHTEVQNEFTNGNDSTSLRSMLNTVFGSETGSLKDFAGKGLPNCDTVSVTNITDDSAQMNLDVTSTGGLETEYKFARRQDGSSVWTVVGQGFTTSTGTQSYVDSFASDTTYEFQARVENAFGQVTGSIIHFTTDAGLPYNLNLSWSRSDFSATANASWSNADSSTSIDFQWRINSGSWTSTTSLSAGTTSYSYGSFSDGDTTRYRVRYSGQTQWATSSQYTSPGGTGGSCFVAGTMVTTYNRGQVRIEALKTGDKILAADIEGFEDTNNVHDLYDWEHNHISKKDAATTIKEIIPTEMPSTVIINGGTLQASNPHSQLVKRGRKWTFMALQNVQEGDMLIDRNGNIIPVKSKELVNQPRTVYKMTLEEPYHTFYANGILTHNIK